MIRVATDVGGTFTDLVYLEIDEKTKIAKKISNQNKINDLSTFEWYF